MSNNRRPQRSKPSKSKRTSAWKPEKRIRDVGSPRNPKHRGNWDD